MSSSNARYIPALSFRTLTRFYDPFIRLTLREHEFKQRLIDQAAIRAGHRVLDVGCGTGTLAMMVKQTVPGAEVVGIDGDPEILEIARGKATAAGLDVRFEEAMAFALPFPPASFDRVLSSLVFHHLTTADKLRALTSVRNVLRPGGALHIADWGRPHTAAMRIAAAGTRLLDGAETTAANLEGKLPDLMREAGFVDVDETARLSTMFGTLSLYRGHLPT